MGKTKNIIQKIIVAGILSITLFCFAAPITHAQNLDIPNKTQFLIAEETKATILQFNIESYKGYQHLSGSEGTLDSKKQLKKLELRVWEAIRRAMLSVAILYIMFAALRMVTSQGDESEFKERKRGIIYAVLALILLALGEDIVSIFHLDQGTFLRDRMTMLERIKDFDKRVELFVSFLKWIVSGLAVAYFLRSGILMILAQGNEEEFKKDKAGMIYSALGLIIIQFSNTAIDKILYIRKKNAGSDSLAADIRFNITEGADQLTGITKMFANFAIPIAILMFVISGIFYMVAGDNEDMKGKAKKMVTYSVIGLLLIYGSFAIVSTFISGDITSPGT